MSYKKTAIITVATIVLIAVIGCATKSKVLNPDDLQSRIAETHAEFRELIASEIDDPERAKSFTALADARDRLINRHTESVKRYASTMKKLNSDYSATREDFENLIQDYNNQRRASQSEFLDLIGRMKASTTEKEWKKLARFELEELNPRTLVYQGGV